MGILLKGGKVLTGNNEQMVQDILIEGKRISDLGNLIPEEGHNVIDVSGRLITPGLIDLHIHLREPGGEHKETIETGTRAAARGGFTTVAAMPNTKPVPDNAEQIQWVNEKIKETASVRVLPYASITIRQAGKELTDFEALKQNGAFAFTDDGVGVQSADMMLQAMTKAKQNEAVIVAHCEENTLIHKGSVHKGAFAQTHGLNGIPSVCEAVQIARDVLLAEATGARYHVCHVSTKESVRVIKDAKAAGIKVTAEVTPHHLLLCDEDIPGLDTNYKMNPPLRGSDDRKALIEAFKSGIIDFLATDHAPHSKDEKDQGMELAPFGIVGLETAFPLLYTNLVQTGVMTLQELVDGFTRKPAEAFELPYGTLELGAVADLTVIDLEHEEKIDPDRFASKGKNTPFSGWSCKGWPVLTIVEGSIKYEKESVNA
ncbi:dihydroorotase [Fictibacillus terranigra]|uniref:Dihydroorotase n=1 Tax=Fictibacillus terranigra TaxID=3058424 RepID=A0ABT8E6J8_9BACL|nr:dihydroorotase [Fictibacillus sp. CENA-BCM004]MDN4073509.1 dihydroorotase [Fictibacillus sp. CENA-BCM004]